MTFTKETPTRPGFYLWRRDNENVEVGLNVEPHGLDSALKVRLSNHRTMTPIPVSDVPGEWCLLVPHDEIKKTWKEAKASTHASHIDAASPDTEWLNSRARRVMEGKE